MRPQKKVIDAAIRSGALPAVDRLLSAAHLLTEIAAHLTEEADDRANNSQILTVHFGVPCPSRFYLTSLTLEPSTVKYFWIQV